MIVPDWIFSRLLTRSGLEEEVLSEQALRIPFGIQLRMLEFEIKLKLKLTVL